jgi:hypothetical protein
MNIMRVSIVSFFIATLSNVALAGQDDDEQKDGAQETISEPDCDNASVPVYL